MVELGFNKTMESLNKSYIKSVLTRLSGHDLLSGSVSECMCKLYGIKTLLPDCEVELSGCHGLDRKHGLYLQCGGELHEGDLCKKCTIKASRSSYGKPPHGLIEERRGKGPDYIAPDGSKAVSFANVAEELGINLEDAEYFAESFGWEIPVSELVYKEKKRGRPKKEKKENVEPAKKRGRPKKEEVIKTQDDLIAEMASQLEIEYEATDGKSNSDRWKEEKELEKANKKAEKERIKVSKELEKANKKAEKELEKANKKAEKERIKTEKNGESKDNEESCSNNEIKVESHTNEETNLIDGKVMELAEDFTGIVTRIDGIQYIITDGFPGDEEEDKEKIVWLCSSLGEVESIGVYNDGLLVLD